MKSPKKHLAKKAFWASMTPEERHFELSRRAKKAWANRPKEIGKARSLKMHLAKQAKKKLSTD